MIQKTIKSYLYWQYNDDLSLNAFVNSYNTMTQEYVDFMNNINLPIYTKQSGALLDWVAGGLYGIQRQAIGTLQNISHGTLNTWTCNTLTPNAHMSVTQYVVTDDILKRIITWHFYKGDGKVFSILWLKRRIERFLFGFNGSDYLGATYRISVSFINENTVLIAIINIVVSVVSGSLPNMFYCNQLRPLNSIAFTIERLSRIQLFDALKKGIDSKTLELPFQFNYIVSEQ